MTDETQTLLSPLHSHAVSSSLLIAALMVKVTVVMRRMGVMMVPVTVVG